MKLSIKAGNKHLISRVPNTDDNRAIVREINKMMKNSDSIYRLFIKYRSPIQGKSYGIGGSLRRDNATTFSVYLGDSRNRVSKSESYYRKRCKDLAIANSKLIKIERIING